MQAQTG